VAALSTILLGTTTTIGLATSISQAGAQRAQGEYQNEMFKINAKFAELQAKDAIDRGDAESDALRKNAKRLIGAQRVSLAAQGIEVDSGTAAAIQEDTARLSELDALQIRNNAWREAWGFKVQAQDFRNQGLMARDAARTQSNMTLVTGGINAVGTGYQAFASSNYYKASQAAKE
jgi:hypothetical protein